MATDFMPRSRTLGKSWSRRIAPSSRLYCVWRWRWVNSAMRRKPLYPRALWKDGERRNSARDLGTRGPVHNLRTGTAAPGRPEKAARMRPMFRVSPTLALALAGALAACGGGPEAHAPPTTPQTLIAMPATIWVQPGQMGTLE